MPRYGRDSTKFAIRCLLASIFSSLCCAQTGHTSESVGAHIELTSGAQISAPIIADQTHRVVVDLGFTILSIPRGDIRDVQQQLTPSEPDNYPNHLYRFGHRSQARASIETNLQRCAEAVLRVQTPVGSGSGFVIHHDGYVITNHHVIDGELRIQLTLFEPNDHELRPITFNNVRIVALDERLDLALLKIEDHGGREFLSVPLGRAAELNQGESVFSIGSPLGFDRTVSQGIISLKNRLMDSQLYLQSTTQINPGNSGGPLFNLYGEVVGVNNMKIGGIGIEGLSFAIPTSTLQLFLDNADAFAFDSANPNHGFRYNSPPGAAGVSY